MASDLLSLTRALVECRSDSDETAVGDVIESWLEAKTDGKIDRDNAGNVLARRGEEPIDVALIGHHDTVAPASSQLEADGTPTWRRENGRCYGRGTADMKGALAAAMLAFSTASIPTDRSVAFASFVGEETGGEGAKAAIEEGFSPDRAIVMEGSTGYSAPGVIDVAIAHNGRREFDLIATGRSAHASEVDAGDNAIYSACTAVEAIRSMEPPTIEIPALEQPMTGSLAVTEIEGGTAPNVIPEKCEVVIDHRTVPGEDGAIGPSELAIDSSQTVDIVDDIPPMVCTDQSFIESVLDTAERVQTAPPEPIAKPHATDAGWLAQAGTECIVCGPAEPGQAHTATESVSIEVLERCRRIYRSVLETV